MRIKCLLGVKVDMEAKFVHNEGKLSLSRLVVLLGTSQTLPSILFFTAFANRPSRSKKIKHELHVYSSGGQEV